MPQIDFVERFRGRGETLRNQILRENDTHSNPYAPVHALEREDEDDMPFVVLDALLTENGLYAFYNVLCQRDVVRGPVLKLIVLDNLRPELAFLRPRLVREI